VQDFIERHSTGNPLRVLDPFAGVGTTVIESAKLGHSGTGIEVSSLSYFVAKTKAISLDSQEIKILDSTIERLKNEVLPAPASPPDNETVVSYFRSEYLDALLRAKAFYQNVQNPKIQSLFKLAFLCMIEPYSTHRKAGNGLKKKSQKRLRSLFGDAVDQVRSDMVSKLGLMHKDIGEPIDPDAVTLKQGNSLEEDSYPDGKFDCVLTSPPYANCFDYSKIYMCELWLGDFFSSRDHQQDFRMNSVRSHVHATWPDRNEGAGSKIAREIISPYLEDQDLWSKKIPGMIKGYFEDLGKLFHVLHPRLRSGSPLGFVVSNSVYGGIPIATDLLLVDTARRHGFEVEQIDVYRHIVPSSQQYVQLDDKDYLRESLVTLRKA